jgi:hypothetical protein
MTVTKIAIATVYSTSVKPALGSAAGSVDCVPVVIAASQFVLKVASDDGSRSVVTTYSWQLGLPETSFERVSHVRPLFVVHATLTVMRYIGFAEATVVPQVVLPVVGR